MDVELEEKGVEILRPVETESKIIWLESESKKFLGWNRKIFLDWSRSQKFFWAGVEVENAIV